MTIKIQGTNTTAAPGITGGDTDTGVQFGTNEVKIVTGGTDRVTVNSSGNTVVAGSLDASGSWPASGTSQITNGGYFARNDTGTATAFEYFSGGLAEANRTIKFTANGAATFAGNISMASGAGIDFSATADAAGMSSELLNDYEVGTFTPTVASGMDNPGYDIQEGAYTKVGLQVHYMFAIRANTGSENGAHLKFGGLPYTSTATANREGAGYLVYNGDVIGNNHIPMFYHPTNSTLVEVYTNTGGAWAGNTANGIGNRVFRLRGTYWT